MWSFITKHLSNVSSGQNVAFSCLVWSWLLPNCKTSWKEWLALEVEVSRGRGGVKWSAPGTNAGCVNRTPLKVGGCQDREKLIVSHYALEATPTKMKSTGRSEGCSNILMTSPVTKKNFKIGPLGDFEKKIFLYFHPALPIKQLG